MSEEFTMEIEESECPHRRPQVDRTKFTSSAMGMVGRTSDFSDGAASPYHPVSPRVFLPSPSIAYRQLPREMEEELSSPKADPVAGVQILADQTEIGFRDTNDDITADPKKDLYKAFFEWVDLNQDVFISRLAECVAIPGVSGDPSRRPQVIQTIAWATRWCEALGGMIDVVDLGLQTLVDGSKIPLPPVLFCTFESGSSSTTSPTLCVYGHLDVQPAERDDGWDTEPFELTEIDGNLYGRGATDDKGPVLCWLWFVEFHRKFNLPLPCNIKCVFEGMEESGSEGLEECLRSVRETFFSDVDGTCISDNYWLGRNRPCLTFGIRGAAYFAVEVRGGQKDLHSGSHGGAVQEPLNDLMKLLSNLVDSSGKILVPGIYEEVVELTAEEREKYEICDFDIAGYANDGVGGMPLLFNNSTDILMGRSRYPSLSLHGIEGAFSGAGGKTVIPRTVIGKFSIRTVPNMAVEHVEECVKRHLVKVFDGLGSSNRLKVNCLLAARPWVGNIEDFNFKAAASATRIVHNGQEPDYTREGGSIPITLTFDEVTGGKPLILLPIGQGDDGAHSQNEKISRWNYITGVKTLGTYVYEFAEMAMKARGE
ncbi:Cytosolic nonspecific dipeptidase, putative [Perkinsus marinus ATCC 50983]|uniref:Cytosolic nonspecific dipeptidase, putative n=1 Tax=Perkinsus marinus (strain ATCC 50983 / TXsc) TaxID=423536 RepID=C5K759_PERM5|nr:Cytosolic nonspecific dipeptidase, putative [Perkinsus marinus ATCC 50983]EER19394.1 Cytosolic nonspecific dipeptidase, putative [Perkinsus marinus ATCC 50983]|eukprot:XP_002787598.1 Cytosolic nonspecific dipeptidase, putative [Perkinsus marinus ATCC 50983]